MSNRGVEKQDSTTVGIQKLRSSAKIPTYGSVGAAGADLYACLEEAIKIPAGQTVLVPTGIAIQLPEHTVGLIYARSGLATKANLAPANKVGVIDRDYRGEIFVPLHNHGQTQQIIERHDRIAQLVVTPYIQAEFLELESLDETIRGIGGFGSTGKK